MNSLVFLYEENGYIVSKLTVYGIRFFIIQNKTTGRKYIRKSLSVVNKIVRERVLE